MKSLIIWHKSTGEIVACVQKFIGSAVEPCIENMFSHRADLWDELDSKWVDGQYTTFKAQKLFKIVDGEPVLKANNEKDTGIEEEEI